MAKRLAGRCGYPEAPHEFDVTLHQDRLSEPLKWQSPQRVFVVSMGDLFHDDVPFSYIAQVFGIMAVTPQHTYQVLTKRPERMLEFYEWGRYQYAFCHAKILRNVWLGVTAENQEQADQRVPLLLQTPAVVRFVSVEPMLGPVYLTSLQCEHLKWDVLTGYQYQIQNAGSQYNWQAGTAQLDWVICGGESGPGARPMHPQWIRELRDQCVETDTPFFFKSWGDWCPKSHTALFPTFDNAMRWGVLTLDGEFFENTTPWNGRNEIPPDFEATVYHIGKKAAGRLLDGRQWDEFPFMARNE